MASATALPTARTWCSCVRLEGGLGFWLRVLEDVHVMLLITTLWLPISALPLLCLIHLSPNPPLERGFGREGGGKGRGGEV
jgi:hypothetical protein